MRTAAEPGLGRLSRADALALVAAGAADRDRDTAGRFPGDASARWSARA